MENRKPNCFVVQGYGKKTDYTNGRELDLDLSYEVIKTAVEAAGVECVRADEIIHSGTIDVPMYERLLNADLVVADLSTNNVNAAFELGVRYALKPFSTIVLAESQFKNPFDLSHIVIRRYEHLGVQGVSFKEANRLIAELKTAIQTILTTPNTDSPVYTYLPQLQPPQVQTNQALPTPVSPQMPPTMVSAAEPSSLPNAGGTLTDATSNNLEDNPSAKAMLDTALDKINNDDFLSACALLEKVKELRPNDSFVIQQFALATYKSKLPTVLDALNNAKTILKKLSPEISNNPETLGLWGAIHKRFWEETGKMECLDESINAYGRGFYIKQDDYNGINLSYLLNVRAMEMLKDGKKEDAIADFVVAKRIRQEVIRYTMPLIDQMEAEELIMSFDPIKKKKLEAKRYWVVSTLWEAAIGLEDEPAIVKWEQEINALPVAKWMQETRETQGAKLRTLLSSYKVLINK